MKEHKIRSPVLINMSLLGSDTGFNFSALIVCQKFIWQDDWNIGKNLVNSEWAWVSW